MPGEVAHRRCPRCGAPLLKDERAAVWCSFVGGGGEKACAYGIDTPITLAEHAALSTQPVN